MNPDSSGERSFTKRLGPWLFPSLFFVLAAACALSPALASGHLFTSRYDWRYFESMAEISRRSVLWWHQAPLWNPYSCGGEVALANPQSLDAAPSFLLVLLFGVALGEKIALVLYHFVALDGMFRLARRFGLSRDGAILAALGYGLSGWFALHFSQGHVTFIGVTLYPYLLLSFDRAVDEIEWVIPTGLVAAWILALGGTFTPPMAAELLFLWATLRAVRRRSLRPFLLLGLAAGVTLCCIAIRMFPVLQFIHDHPRPPFMRATDRMWPHEILASLTFWRALAPVEGHRYWSHEYTARLPWLLVPFALASLVLPFFKRAPIAPNTRPFARDLLVLLLVAALLVMGNFSPVAPWSLLQRLPVLRDLRVPSRHLILVVLALAPLAGMAWDTLVAFVIARRGEAWRARFRWLGGVAIAIVAADGAAFIAWQYGPWNPYGPAFASPGVIPSSPPRFYQVHGLWRTMRDTLFAGHGSIDTPGSKEGPGCDEEAPLQRADELDAGDVPQERLLDPAAGEIVSSRWSPNIRAIEVRLDHPTILLVNSNWNEHWHVDGEDLPDGPRMTRVAGRLSVDLGKLPPGKHTVTLRYAPRAFTVGTIVTLVSLPLALFIFVLARRRRARPRA